jgi:gliding motility-associated-like protein
MRALLPNTSATTSVLRLALVAIAALLSQGVVAQLSITCPGNITQNNDSGQCSAVVNFTPPVGTGGGTGIITFLSGGLGPGNPFPVGTTVVTYTTANNEGDEASCSFNVVVNDIEDPVFDCPTNFTINSDPGECGAVFNFPIPTATDNCEVVTAFQFGGPPSGTLIPLGNTNFDFQAEDAAGNIGLCRFVVTVVDAGEPTIVCPADITANATTTCSEVVTYTAPVGNDACSPSTTTLTGGLGSGASFPVGTTTETYTVTDADGNSATCSFAVTVVDVAPPVITCPGNITLPAGAGCEAVVNYAIPTATDNCPDVEVALSQGLPSGSTFPTGTTTITYTATDASGNESECSFTVTVTEDVLPAIACPANISVSTASATCEAVVNYQTPVGTDNCPGATTQLTAGLASGATFPLGTTPVTYTVTDAAGNTASCTFNVTVSDLSPPIFDCPTNVSSGTDPDACNAVVSFPTPGATDNCSAVTVVQTAGPMSGATFPTGSTPVTFTATDELGNSATCTFSVVVSDLQPPVITCPPPVNLTIIQNVCDTLLVYDLPTAVDNCPGVTVSFVTGLTSGVPAAAGTYTTIYQAVDASGNTATCSFPIAIAETEPPLIDCPADLTVQTPPGNCEATINFSAPPFSDACSAVSIAQTGGPSSGSSLLAGIYPVTFTATDEFGNSTDCTFNVIVTDGNPPALTCTSETINATTEPGLCGATVNYPLPTANDPCGPVTIDLAAGLGSGAFFPPGTYEEVYAATDVSGNTATCTITIVVTDAEAPLITCPDDVLITGLTACEAVVNYPAPTATDNCAVADIALTGGIASGETFPVGPTTVSFTATDAAGNEATCSFAVTLLEIVPPVVDCPGDISATADPQQCTANVDFDPPTATDNCGEVTITQTAGPAPGSAFPPGSTAVTYIISDLSGNEVVCTFNVVVNDVTPPTLLCSEPTVVPNEPGQCGAVVNYPLPTASDACGNLTIALTSGLGSGAFFAPGTYEEVYTATDESGNEATCTIVLTVNDAEMPVIVCPDDILVSGLEACEAVVNYPAPVASDNCAVVDIVLTLGLASGESFPAGISTVTYQATDAAGNTGTCSFTVTVLETIPPVVDCPGDFSIGTDPGQCSAIVTFPAPTATDNCGQVIIVQTAGPASGSSFPVGSTAITYTISDLSGNEVLCTFNVVVTDTQAPLLACPNNQSIPTDPGQCAAVYTFALPEAGDNCDPSPVVVQTAGPASAASLPVGTHTFAFTATDATGNQGTCTYTVTVVDAEAPTFSTCPGDSEVVLGEQNCEVVVQFSPPTAIDNCGATVTQTTGPTSGSSLPAGVYVISFIAADDAGNTATCTFSITVTDSTPPVLLCPDDFESCDEKISFDVPVAVDACGIASVEQTGGPTSGSAFPVGETTITFTATDVNGNQESCTFTITRLPGGTRPETGPDRNICAATSTNLAANSPDIGSGLWTLFSGAGTIANASDPNSPVTGLQAGANVFIWTIDPENGCPTQTDTLTITVEPDAVLTIGTSTTILLGQSAQLFADTGPPGGDLVWEPSQSLSCSDCSNPIATPEQTTMYTATYTTPTGCVLSDSVTVTVSFDLPNTITPNGDGVNDVWNIPGIGAFPDAEVRIYNRWGAEVFGSRGYQEPWDGKRDGKDLPTGSYFYIIDFKQSGKANLNGTVNIIR